jgi:acetolactate synthase-1/2/3 large subunit
MKISDVVVDFLEKKGIEHVFTVSGGGCIHLIDSLGSSEKIKYICTHHEQSAAMAAEGYARLNQKIGACIVTTGPGGTNAITGVLGCWLDSIPSIFISGQVSTNQLSEGTNCRQIGDQEFDIVSSIKNMTKYAVTVKNKNDILFHLEKAYYLATSGRPGPVWLDIPLDIQGSYVNLQDLHRFIPVEQKKHISFKQIEKFKKLLYSSKKPLFIVGNGIRLSNSYDEFNELLEKTKIPALTSVHSGVDCVNNEYEFYAGRIGVLGNITSNKIVQESDLLIILGSRLNIKTTGYNIDKFSPNSKKIYIDIDKNEIKKHSFNIDLKIVSDVKKFINQIKNITIPEIDEWRKFVKNVRKEQIKFYPKHENMKNFASAYYFISKLENYCDNLPIITSNGTAHVATLQTLILKKHQRMFTNVGCASMGYGMPAAIGACFANNKQPVICMEGDGSIQMNLQDIQTIIHHQLPIKIFIINNDGYISIKITQQSFFSGKQVASGKESGISFPDMKKISNAYGIKYYSIKNNSEIDDVLKHVMDENNPLICEIFTHPNEKHEPKVVHAGIDVDGKIIPGSLTNMYVSDNICL